ncbi:MAG: hypothetical protein IM526_02335 [Microcystis sp. M38BS1]|uniref:hypothetical protein n=1 Tax=Microcystis sp. M38BS1 TaxID=2771188 RepID=UPI0031FBE62A|nr:hypothetical protein [Microcystis sp. M38BS1]MCA6582492.1 hypothetical protein [Pseudanabaena sp. M34BS1SP1A06MG]
MKTLRKYIQQLEALAAKYGDDIPVVRKQRYQFEGQETQYSPVLAPKVIGKNKNPRVVIEGGDAQLNDLRKYYEK